MKPERLILINYLMVFLTIATLLTIRDSTILATVTLLTIWNIPLLIENTRTLKLLALKPKPPRQVKEALELLVELLREFFESAPLREGSTKPEKMAYIARGIAKEGYMNTAVKEAREASPEVTLEKVHYRIGKLTIKKLTDAMNMKLARAALWAKKNNVFPKEPVHVALDLLEIEIHGAKMREKLRDWIFQRKEKHLFRFLAASSVGREGKRLALAILPVKNTKKPQQHKQVKDALRRAERLLRIKLVLGDSAFANIKTMSLEEWASRSFAVRIKRTERVKKFLANTFRVDQPLKIISEAKNAIDQRSSSEEEAGKLRELAAYAKSILEWCRILGKLGRMEVEGAEDLCKRMRKWLRSCKPTVGRVKIRGKNSRKEVEVTVAVKPKESYFKKAQAALRKRKTRKEIREEKNVMDKALERKTRSENIDWWNAFTGVFTNAVEDSGEPLVLLSLFTRERNQIETVFRDRGPFQLKSKSPSHKVRFFTFTLSLVLHNLWLIVNAAMLEEVEIDDLPSKERKKIEEEGEMWCVIIITRVQFKKHLEEASAALKPLKKNGEPPSR